MNFETPIIIACDFASEQKLDSFLNNFKKQKLFLKLGMQIIYREGFNIIEKLKKQGHQIFLDLKLHDIPITVAKGLESLSSYQPDLISIHALGGWQMLEEAQKISKKYNLTLTAISLLTSLDSNNCQEIGLKENIETNISKLFTLIKKAKLDYVVCSVQEASLARKYGLKPITPGIYLEKANHDQKRVANVKEAFAKGAELIVIGRAITRSNNPHETYQKVLKEWNNGSKF